MARFNFDSSAVEPAQGFDLIPSGSYIAHIVESEIKDTKAGNGQYIAFTFNIVQGQYVNRKLFASVNIANPNEQAVEIGRAQLSAICRAAGVAQMSDTAQLHNKLMLIRVGVSKPQPGYDQRNEIKSWETVSKGGGIALPTQREPGADDDFSDEIPF